MSKTNFFKTFSYTNWCIGFNYIYTYLLTSHFMIKFKGNPLATRCKPYTNST